MSDYSINLREQPEPPRRPLDPIEAAGLRYTTPPQFGDVYSAGRHQAQQRELEQRADHEFVVSVRCSIIAQSGKRYTESQPITPTDVHVEAALGLAALQALSRRGVVVWSDRELVAANKAKASP